MNKDLMANLGFKQEMEDVKAGKCPFCKVVIDPTKFTDTLSYKEYQISGLCQKCQDEIFSEDEE